MTRITRLIHSVVVLTGLASFSRIPVKGVVPERRNAASPNIMIILFDDHALKAISAYSSPYIKTPNIDRIGREGAVFENMFCTNSICAPSHATLLTGKYSYMSGRHVMAHFGIRTDRYKLIYFYGNGEFWEFFDLKTDPDEMKNDYANPKNQAIVSQLKRELKKLTQDYKDTEATNMLAKEGV